MPFQPDNPLFKIVDEPAAIEAVPVEADSTEAALPDSVLPRRGVGWVLRWAATLVTISFSLLKFVDFSYQVDLEQTLNRAARAGALEATLPRASVHSVAQLVERRLSSLAAQSDQWDVRIEQNGAPVRGLIAAKEGDEFAVVVTLAGGSTLPGWLRGLNLWSEDRPIEARRRRRKSRAEN